MPVEQEVADRSATDRGDRREGDDADQVEALPPRREGAADREDRDADEVERADQLVRDAARSVVFGCGAAGAGTGRRGAVGVAWCASLGTRRIESELREYP